ncbi:TlpA disulfide reductase family protein [Algoriphagus sp. Y33]|uniref:TlpA disulfide reductase family protein n=1 Tax=Algoriphagus sp. Y33 TaxID=2772483 RepID=UPI001782F49F|nr:TlpA disulfide reductase family protein [Algoriphagus sp. Y33]
MNKLLIAGLMLFCTTANAQNDFKISGKLNGFEENALVKIERENIILDSCYLKNGKFQLSGSFEQSPTPAYLTIENGEDVVYTSLFIGNENITINANSKDFPYAVKTNGSEYDQLRYDYNRLEESLNTRRKIFLNEMFSLREQGKWNDSLQNAYWNKSEPLGKIRNIDNQLDKIRDEFIDENFNSYYGLYLIGVYKTEIPKSKLQNYFDNLSQELKNTAYAKSINSHLKNPDLKIGEKYYDFPALDKTGKRRLFSDYFSDKYVLLDFSTVYCGWCLKAISDLEKIKNTQGEKLEIVTFYVDKNEKGFEELVLKHNEKWNVLWDKEGRLSDTYAKYKVFGTPTFYLFDPNGKLVQLFNGYLEDLSEQIEKAIINN